MDVAASVIYAAPAFCYSLTKSNGVIVNLSVVEINKSGQGLG